MNDLKTTEARKHGDFFLRGTSCLCAFVAILFFLTPTFLLSQTISQDLNSNWVFSESGKNKWLTAKVPGTVHTDLFSNGEIVDPYLQDNETKVQWVETKTWEYQSTFDVDPSLVKCKHKDLVFEGLDTYAFIYLNDSLLLTTENMFRTYRIDVAKFLKKKTNVLRIVFHPASELIELNKSKSDIKNLPGGDRVFIRKAQYQFGWDFGPRLVTCGIWKPVHLEGWNDFEMRDVTIRTIKIENDTATMIAAIPIFGSLTANTKISISEGATVFMQGSLPQNKNTFSNYIEMPFKIPHPRIWWCNGSGKANLYHFKINLQCGKINTDTIITTGIRTIKLIQVDETTDSSFYFELNGRAIFVKGANWIPCDNFLPRVATEKYYSLIKSAQQSNMNMLRVWGGGAYEDDKFYNICDSLGIMVWQDFMFACAMYPGDNHFLSEVKAEARDNVIHLQNHPCISLWCGNNENSEGWENWDWQQDFKYTEVEKKTIMADYNSLFGSVNGIFEIELKKCADENFSYIESSPAKGWGNPSAYKNGDVHYWGVWWGKEPFSAYDNHVGMFMSEYGFQGLPSFSSIQKFETDTTFWMDFPKSDGHQKNEKGFRTIAEYMTRDYPAPSNLSNYVYLSQVMQRDGISKAIEAHRRAMSFCMGTMFWQYNDCWPGITWSTNDYYGQPKLLQYALKDLYAPLMVSVTERNDSVFVYVVNDDTISHKGILGFQWMTFEGQNVRTSIAQTNVNGESSNLILSFPRKEILDTLSPNRGVMNVVFSYEGDKTVSTKHYFANDKSLQLSKDPGLSVDVAAVKNANGSYTLTLRTISLAKNIYLTLGNNEVKFSDNGFDMMPLQTKEIEITTNLSPDQIRNQLKVQVMNGL